MLLELLSNSQLKVFGVEEYLVVFNKEKFTVVMIMVGCLMVLRLLHGLLRLGDHLLQF